MTFEKKRGSARRWVTSHAVALGAIFRKIQVDAFSLVFAHAQLDAHVAVRFCFDGQVATSRQMAYVLRRRISPTDLAEPPSSPLVQNSSEFLADGPRPSRQSIQFQNWWYERILLPLMNTASQTTVPTRRWSGGLISGGRLYPTLQSAYSRSGT